LKKLPYSLGKLLVLLQADDNLSPVPGDNHVIRLARPPKDFQEKGQISAIQLEEDLLLSEQDKKSKPPHLSVWVDKLTSPQQAYSFLAPDSPRRLVLRLSVEEIRKIIGRSDDGQIHAELLNVIWVHLGHHDSNGVWICDSRLGAAGHSGITGLHEGAAPRSLTKSQAKRLRKDLRAQLAELASKDCFHIVDSDLGKA
jgi:hypothetical protein